MTRQTRLLCLPDKASSLAEDRTPSSRLSLRCLALIAGTTAMFGCALETTAGNAPRTENIVQVPSYALASTAAQSLVAAAVSPARNQGGFPTWYSDANGTAVEPCLDPFDPHCVLLGAPGIYDIAGPMVFPANYPNEFFYFVADVVPIPTSQCGNVGSLKVRFALEGTFFNVFPKAGDQMVFGRLRLLGDGLCPLHDYVLKHPYGSLVITTDDRGRVRPRNPAATADIGCIPAPGAPCDFSLALGSTALANGFLTWDPAIAPAADPGYIGGIATVPHKVVGGLNNVNSVTLSEVNGTVLYSTDLFLVAGKKANVLKASTDLVDVGRVLPGVIETRSVVVTNASSAPVTISAPTLTDAIGPWTTDTSCTAPLPAGGTCTITVAFTGDVNPAAASALLNIGSSASAIPLLLTLVGTSVAPGTVPDVQVVTADKQAIASYGRVILNTTRTQLLLVRNEGPGPFTFNSLATADQLAGSGDAAAFTFTSACPVGGVMVSGQTCQIALNFRPTAHKPYAAGIHANGMFGASPATTISLFASGRGGIAMSSATSDGLGTEGFPRWYQDDGDPANPAAAATRVVPCLDVTNPYCVILPDATFNAALPLVFPTNYPGEAFYYLADAQNLPVADCGIAGTLGYREAMEQSFTTGVPIAGNQMTFARQRFTVTGGLCPGTEYTLVHPYGVSTLFVDAVGGIKAKNGTVDVGCIPALNSPCNFDLAVVTSLSDSFLRWDPAVLPAAPAGYLGDPAVLHAVTGSPFGTNFITLTNNTTGLVVATTNQFLIAGKLATPALTASTLNANFASVTPAAPGNTSQQSIIFTNAGTAPNTITAVTLANTVGTGFSIVSNGCLTTLQARQSCTVIVRLTGAGATGARDARLTVTSGAPTLVVSLHGTVGTVAVAVASPLSLAFGSLALNVTSAAQTTVLSNTGPTTTTWRLTSPVAGRATAVGPFSVTPSAGCGTGVAGGGSCTVSVTFKPTTGGAFTNTLSLVTSAGTQTVTLTGTGTALPSGTLTPATAAISGGKKPGTAIFVLTNTGLVPLVMVSPAVAVTGTNAANFTITANTCPAAGGGLVVLGTCKLTVTYVRAAGTAVTVVHQATLTVNTKAGAKTVAMTGIN